MKSMDENLIISRYKAGESLNSISKKLGHCAKTMKKILIKNNILIRFTDNGRRKFPLNDNYFEFINTPLKAYFLGWMYSDGFVLKDGYCSGINLQKEDRAILEKFSEETFSSTVPVYDLKKARGNAKFQSRLIFKSRKFQSFLLKQGVIHNKSLTLEPPLNIPDSLLKYFILAYFEGDGCFSGSILSIVSTKNVCKWIGDIFVSICGIKKYKLVETQNKITYRLVIWGKEDLCKIYNYFYKDNSFYLNRKKIKIEEYMLKEKSVKKDKIFTIKNGEMKRKYPDFSYGNEDDANL